MLGLILALPLVGFLINGCLTLINQKVSSKIAGIIASSAIFVSFIISVSLFFSLSGVEGEAKFVEETLFNWIETAGFSLPFVLRFDALTAIMCLVVTGVGFLIHVYSIGYMEHDESPSKFFAYLNLFSFSMLALVLGGSLPILFLGWEGVGLCSYLLIGYWYQDDAKASAGKKAFIVNRIGDLGFLIGIFTLFGVFNTLDFVGMKQALGGLVAPNIGLLTFATMCLFVGAMGKSAQIPLYVWLPDAMAGPTPVSALIHAATMVTAGVYMIARLNYIFALCPQTLVLISIIGAMTAFFAATIAIVQTDIKKVLAYSTVSQLGYMFVAVGVGAFTAGIFHVVTHAFFKALLFLGSGSVIHAMHEEQDITKMGGLKKYMPQTFITFAIGTFAIAGIPPLAGFFSKDEILWEAFSSHMGAAGPLLWAFGAMTALMTAFYMTRLLCLTFLGNSRFGHDVHPHESPMVMVAPLLVLAVLSVLGGFIGIPGHSWLAEWLSPVIPHAHAEGVDHAMEYLLMFVSVVIAISGCGLAYYMYVLKPEIPKQLQQQLRAAYKVLFNKYYVDELYEAAFIKPIQKLSTLIWKYIDVLVIDGAVLGLAKVSRLSGEVLRLAHTGSIQIYGVFILIGLIGFLGYILYGLV